MAAVDGLATGINSNQMIQSMLAADGIQRNQLSIKKTATKREADAIADIKKMYVESLEKVKAVNKATAWQAKAAAVSNDAAVAVADSGAANASLSFTVDKLATGERVYTPETMALSAIVATSGRYAGMDAEQFVSAVNADPSLGTTASLVMISPGNYRIMLSSTSTGADATVGVDPAELDQLGGKFTELTAASDAQITFQGTNPFSVTSPSNTFADVSPGLDVTVTKLSAEPVDVTVSSDVDAVAAAVGSVVESIAAALAKVDSYNSVRPGASGVLSGYSAIRRSETDLRNDLVAEVAGNHFSTASLAGVQLGSDGKISFDADKFKAAYAEDPQAVQDLFFSEDASADTVFSRLTSELENATNITNGYLSSAEDAAQSRVRRIDDQLSAWDVRLESREQTYREMFTRLETAMSQLQQQSSWLTGQLASLPTASMYSGS